MFWNALPISMEKMSIFIDAPKAIVIRIESAITIAE